MLFAAGNTRIIKNVPGLDGKVNLFNLHTRQDHENLMRELKNGVKKIAVMGLNMESLETVSTIRREFPKIHITVIDDSRENMIEQQYGKDVAQSLIQ